MSVDSDDTLWECWYGDEFIDIVSNWEKLCLQEAHSGHHFKYCPGFGP